jgi:uncharacterized protein YabN with tetrapyrrole methylase and pyrophosphatase domain
VVIVGESSLTVVGVGVEVPAHVTLEARAQLEFADEVLYLVADGLAGAWIESVNARSRSLEGFYAPGIPRSEIYAAIVEEVLARLHEGGRICFALYGHPGVLADPGHAAIRRARREGYAARLLPGISAQDCLFADLGIDPGVAGCQSYEATDLLIHRREIDPSAGLVLWQVATVGNVRYAPDGAASQLPVLVRYLERYYAIDHEVIVYEASPFPFIGPVVQYVPLGKLPEAGVPRMSLLFIPPAAQRTSEPSIFEAETRPAATTLPFAL